MYSHTRAIRLRKLHSLKIFMSAKLQVVQFGALTTDEWIAISAAELTTASNRGSTNTEGTPYDPRLGALENGVKCDTCGEINLVCPGHFGHIVLPEPCFNPEYIETVVGLLKCICLKCQAPRLSANVASVLPSSLKRSQRFRLYRKKAEILKQCSSPTCQEPLPQFFVEKTTIKYYYGDKKSAIPITAREVHSILIRVSSETMKLIGFNGSLSENDTFVGEDVEVPVGKSHVHEIRPEAFIFEVLPVVPTCARPFVVRGSNDKKDDDLTDEYNTILKIKARLEADRVAPSDINLSKTRKRGGKLSEADRKKLLQDLQNHVSALIDNSKEGKGRGNSRQHKGFRERLATKEGHIQSNIAGKRVDFTARAVIVGAGPDLPLGWVGIPETIAKKVTISELVMSWNLAIYEKLLKEGKINAVKRQGNIIRVKEATKGGTVAFTWKGKTGLQPYDIVDRHCRDGDWVIINRQPTLRIESMQGVQVKLLIGEYVFRIPLGMTRPMNADFDGDEMNIHIAQSQGGRIECSTIARTAFMIVSAQNNAPVMGCVQNTLICMYLLTETFETPEDPKATGEKQKPTKFFNDETPAYETFIDSEDFIAALEVANISAERTQDLFVRAKKYYPKYIKGDPSNPSSLKLASRVPGKILASVVFPRTFTWSRKTGVNERMPEVKIRNGIIQPDSGPLCKKTIGGTSGSTVHALWKISPDTASRMISECQFISSLIISRIGFSMGVADALPTKLEEVKAAINEARIKCDMINVSNKDSYDKEREINGALNEAMGIAPRLAKTSMNKGDRNALVIMQKCGAKGSVANNGQISGFVGQQNIDGKRAPFMLCNGTRTLPHFLPHDNSPDARGFVDRSYLEGLDFRQVWFHAAAGRRGVIDTAMKTADSGYIQKKCVKKVEDCRVYNDGTVRDINGIVQFLYGGDGLNAKELMPCNGIDFPFFCNPNFIASTLNSEAEFEIDAGNDAGKLRVMSKEEIDLLCSFIQSGCPGVQSEVTERSSYNIKTILRTVIGGIKIYETKIPMFCRSIKDEYEEAKAKDGYMAGLVSASSIGEPTTQLTLNSFHSTGMSAKDVTLGVPKLKEVLNATRKPSKPTCTVQLNDEKLLECQKAEKSGTDADSANKTALARVTEIANSFTHLTVEYFMKSYELQYLIVEGNIESTDIEVRTSPLGLLTYEMYEKRWWVTLAENLGNKPEIEPDGWVILIQLDINKLYTYGITPQDIAKCINNEAVGAKGESMECIASPTNIAELEVYLNFSAIHPFTIENHEISSETQSAFDLLTEDNIDYFTAREVAVSMIKKTKVQGVNGITKTYVRQEPTSKEWFVDTQGTNLMDILAVNGVNTSGTFSDDIWEIYNVFGIEAVRVFLIEEITRILSFDGTYINPRHISLLVDAMCRTGVITSVNRDGISRNVGPIAKGMFEKAVDNFAEAAAFGEFDKMKGVSAAVMYGTLPEVGTGTVTIKDSEKLPAARKPVKLPPKKTGLAACKKK